MTHTKRWATVFCAAAIVLSSLAGSTLSRADTGDDKARVDQQVQDLKASLDETSAALATAYLALQDTQSKLPAAQAALAQAQAAEQTASQRNDAVAAQLAVAKADQQRATETVASNATKVAHTQAMLDQFAADVFQGGGGASQMSVALGATSPQDFADRVVLADQVSSMTNDALQDLQNARADGTAQQAYLTSVQSEVAGLKQQAETSLAQAQTTRQSATVAKAQLDALQAQQAQYAAQVDAARAGEEQQLQQAEVEQAQLQGMLQAQATAAVAAEAAKRAATVAAGQTYVAVTGGTGFLSHPVNGPITSPFGMRFHPILHVWKLHTGTDFGVPCGTPVYAAADGTVISAGWGGGDGNRIVVDHGIISGVDLASTYNHLSSFVVQSGAVKRGQLIAYSGTTGYSTGCHLHFETLENGQFVNPITWL